MRHPGDSTVSHIIKRLHIYVFNKSIDYADRSIANLLPLAEATPKLRESVLTFDPYKLDCYVEQFYPMYLNIVCKMVSTSSRLLPCFLMSAMYSSIF